VGPPVILDFRFLICDLGLPRRDAPTVYLHVSEKYPVLYLYWLQKCSSDRLRAIRILAILDQLEVST